jgi:hypothetical protein
LEYYKFQSIKLYKNFVITNNIKTIFYAARLINFTIYNKFIIEVFKIIISLNVLFSAYVLKVVLIYKTFFNYLVLKINLLLCL